MEYPYNSQSFNSIYEVAAFQTEFDATSLKDKAYQYIINNPAQGHQLYSIYKSPYSSSAHPTSYNNDNSIKHQSKANIEEHESRNFDDRKEGLKEASLKDTKQQFYESMKNERIVLEYFDQETKDCNCKT